MRHLLACTLLLVALSGCAGSERPAERPLALADESWEPQQGTRFCYQLIVCPLVRSQ